MDAEAHAYEAAHKELDEQETPKAVQVAGVGDAIKKGAAALGKAILGDGTKNDATGAGRAHKLHIMEAEANGQTPMSREDFEKSHAQKG